MQQRLFVEELRYDLWSHWFEAIGLEFTPQHRHYLSDDDSVQLDGVILGHGVAITRGLIAANDLRAGRLACPFQMAARLRQ